jgi:hypothetical protein
MRAALGPWTIQNQQSATDTPGRHAREHAQHARKLGERALRELHDWEGQAPADEDQPAPMPWLSVLAWVVLLDDWAGEAAHRMVDAGISLSG